MDGWLTLSYIWLFIALRFLFRAKTIILFIVLQQDDEWIEVKKVEADLSSLKVQSFGTKWVVVIDECAFPKIEVEQCGRYF